MIRVLHVISSMDRGGGAQSLLMEYFRHMDRNKIQFDFVVHRFNYGEKALYDDEITALGGKVYFVPVNRIRYPMKYIKWWKNFFREHSEYDIVEGHILTSAIVYLFEAKRAGCHTVAHSHSTWEKGGPWLHALLTRLSIWPIRMIADDYTGCSIEAGLDMFGKRIVNSERYRIVTNVIECERFYFSQEKRVAIRNKYSIRDENFLVGHVGRFSPQKNHVRLLEIFKLVHERLPEARLILLGGGELLSEVQNKCDELGLSDVVIFAGLHENIEDYYSAMDVFCFPSLWEGLGMVAVEAQANGLPCVVADTIPKVADIKAELFEAVSLKQSNERWATVILEQKEKGRNIKGIEYARRAGYDVELEVRKMEEYYSVLVSSHSAT